MEWESFLRYLSGRRSCRVVMFVSWNEVENGQDDMGSLKNKFSLKVQGRFSIEVAFKSTFCDPDSFLPRALQIHRSLFPLDATLFIIHGNLGC